MNILFCNFEYPPLGGGGGVINAQVAQELVKNHQVTVLTSQGMDLPAESCEEGVRVVRAPVFFRNRSATANLQSMLAYIPMGIMAGRRLLQAERFDVINTHFVLPSGPVGDALSQIGGIPHVLTVHGGDLYDPSKLTSPHRHGVLRAWIRSLLRRADVVVGGSTNTLENMHQFYTPEIEGLRIPLGIKRPQCYESRREDFGFGPDEILLVTVGRLVKRKSVDQLITMLSQIQDPRVHLVVIGSGPEMDALKAQAAALGVANRVHLMGFVDECDKFRLLKISDVYVSTSQHEGFSLSNLEGMTTALPIVAYDYGGHTDYLRDGQTGFLVPLNDLDLFTRRTVELVQNLELRSAMGKYNLEVVEDYYVDTTASRYEQVFAKAAEQYKPRLRGAGFLRSRSASMD